MSINRTRLGVQLANMGRPAMEYGIAAMATTAENVGVDSLWVSDHLLNVDHAHPAYPHQGRRQSNEGPHEDWLEALTSLAVAAAVTTRPTIGTNVLVLPQRNTLQLAKTVATLDHVSAGRMILGVGSGWNQDEFEALGYYFRTRGTRTDEMLKILRASWSGTPEPFTGKEVTVPPGVVLLPRPLQPAGVPIFIGGNTARARERVIEHGDGWLALGNPGQYDPATVGADLATLRARRAARGGQPLRAIFALWVPPHETAQLPQRAVEIARVGFDEVVLHGIWDGGLAAAAATIAAVRDAFTTAR